MLKTKSINIKPGYGGYGASIEVYTIDPKQLEDHPQRHILELDEAKRIIKDRLEEGYTTELKLRQQIYRIKAT